LSTLFSDDFSRADGALGANWADTYTGEDAPQIVSQVLNAFSSANRASASVTAISAPNNQWAQVTLAAMNNVGGVQMAQVLLRAAPAPTVTWYELQATIGSGSFTSRIRYRTDASNATTIASENATVWAASDVLYGEVQGTTIKLFRNGSQLLSVSDANLASGAVGLSINTPGGLIDCQVDNFLAGDFPATLVTPLTDAPLSPRGPAYPSNLRTFSGTSPQFMPSSVMAQPLNETPFARGTPYPFDLRTFTNNLSQSTLKPPTPTPPGSVYAWELGRAQAYPQNLRTHTAYSVFDVSVKPPRINPEQPLAKAPIYPLNLRTNTGLVAAFTTIPPLPPQAAALDIRLPRGAPYSMDLRSASGRVAAIITMQTPPPRGLDWALQPGRFYPTDLRTSVNVGSNLSMRLPQTPFTQIDQPLPWPRQYPMGLRTAVMAPQFGTGPVVFVRRTWYGEAGTRRGLPTSHW
jgi:hypothetical protein